MTVVETAPAEKAAAGQGRVAGPATPRVGEVIRRLRRRRGLSLRDLAEQSGLSQSFLGAVERGQSDISVGRRSRPSSATTSPRSSATRSGGPPRS